MDGIRQKLMDGIGQKLLSIWQVVFDDSSKVLIAVAENC